MTVVRYLAECRECADGSGPVLKVRCTAEWQRDEWANQHTDATGHVVALDKEET